jgi:hypothetical protein
MEERQPVGARVHGTATTIDEGPAVGLDDPRVLQILMTEHWGLLATRSMSWNETFSRAGMFLTALSGAIVALALVAQVSSFGEGFLVFAFILLPFALFVGLATFIRLVQSSNDELHLVLAMNRLRHGYLDMAPAAAPYLSASPHDDLPGYFVSIGPAHVGEKFTDSRPNGVFATIGGILHGLVTTAGRIGTIDAFVAGVIGALVGLQVGLMTAHAVLLGALVAVVVVLAITAYAVASGVGMSSRAKVRFPSPLAGSESDV